MADYIVTTDFKAHDLVSPTLKTIDAHNKQFAQKTQRTFRDVFKGSFAGTLGAHAVSAGLSHIRYGIQGVVDDYKDFDSMINAAAVKFGGIDYGTEDFKELGAVAREVGRTTKFESSDAAEGLEAMAGAGIEAANAMKLLPVVANFAAAAKMDLAQATEVAGGSLNAFAMQSKNATEQATNLNTISDVLAQTDASTRASMQGLAETVSWAAGRFTGAGQELQTFGAVAGGLADVMVDGSVAGTVMKNMIKGLTSETPKTRKALKALGLSIKGDIVDQEGNLNNVIDIMAKMEDPFKKLGTAEGSRVLTDLFGDRAVSGVTALLNAGIGKVKQLEKELYNSAGASKKMGDQLNQSLTARVMALQNALTEKGFQVFEKFLVDGRGGIESMIDAINKWDVDPIADAMKQIASALSFAARHTGDIISIGKAFLVIKGAMLAMDSVRWLKGLGGATGGLGGLMTPLGQMVSAGAAGAAPMAPSVMSMAGAAGAGIPALPSARYTGRYDNWGRQPTAIKASKVSLDGAVSVIMSAAAAAGVGWQIGTVLRENFVEPSIDRFFETMDNLDTKIMNVEHQLRTGKMGAEEATKEVSKMETDVKKMSESWASIMFGSVTSLFTGEAGPLQQIGEKMADITKIKQQLPVMRVKEELQKSQDEGVTSIYGPAEPWEKSTPAMDQYKAGLESQMASMQREREDAIQHLWAMTFSFKEDEDAIKKHEATILRVDKAQAQYTKHLEKLNEATRDAAAQGGTAVVKVEVSGEGASRVTTSSKSSGPKAPRVDVSQAGAN